MFILMLYTGLCGSNEVKKFVQSEGGHFWEVGGFGLGLSEGPFGEFVFFVWYLFEFCFLIFVFFVFCLSVIYHERYTCSC